MVLPVHKSRNFSKLWDIESATSRPAGTQRHQVAGKTFFAHWGAAFALFPRIQDGRGLMC